MFLDTRLLLRERPALIGQLATALFDGILVVRDLLFKRRSLIAQLRTSALAPARKRRPLLIQFNRLRGKGSPIRFDLLLGLCRFRSPRGQGVLLGAEFPLILLDGGPVPGNRFVQVHLR